MPKAHAPPQDLQQTSDPLARVAVEADVSTDPRIGDVVQFRCMLHSEIAVRGGKVTDISPGGRLTVVGFGFVATGVRLEHLVGRQRGSVEC
jgi:hypothetical protein